MKSNSCKFLFSSLALVGLSMLGACAATSVEDHTETYVASEHRTGTNLRGRSGDGVKNMSQEEIDTLKSRAAISGRGPSN